MSSTAPCSGELFQAILPSVPGL
uniref:Uncharacterized protein n=1 Tax=Arundo donax TaxID=35708 RepID=A0A0A9HUS8_ARUDO